MLFSCCYSESLSPFYSISISSCVKSNYRFSAIIFSSSSAKRAMFSP
ncbi:hypothetical protein HMPREF1870_02917, partial [Bacteroidales bacterium KA00344]